MCFATSRIDDPVSVDVARLALKVEISVGVASELLLTRIVAKGLAFPVAGLGR
ncbi:hypothetical protein LBWT_X3110 (plasmid) [Leptolyngbya boryana IAM M-101]|nr:hypothetical protein LBWT_X3110 [Leptolyngbya boryana IAM M-101]BAS66587.1 hypothetical protein LBDG_X3110 [Leptolyngbya boryana dg5]